MCMHAEARLVYYTTLWIPESGERGDLRLDMWHNVMI